MKSQKKATVARKATKMPTIAKKRRSFLEKVIPDAKKEKKAKKPEMLEDAKKKVESDKKKSEKVEEKRKVEDRKKIEEKRKEKMEKMDEKKKCAKDEKKWEKLEEKKLDKVDEKITDECAYDIVEKKRVQKMDDKTKLEKQCMESKKKFEKAEEKKKSGKLDDEIAEDQTKVSNVGEENETSEEKLDAPCSIAKKKCKDEKKKDGKLIKTEVKENMKISVIKDKKSERKKFLEKGTINSKGSLARTKKNSKTKSVQKKGISKKPVLAKKSHLSTVQKLVDKKIKLNELIKDEETPISEEDETLKKTKKKNVNISKNKIMQEKKSKLRKHMKAKLPSKNNKISATLKKDDKFKTLIEKVASKKKIDSKEMEKSLNEHRKIISKEETVEEIQTCNVKNEVEEDKDVDKTNKEDLSQSKSQDIKKSIKNNSKISKKIMKKKVPKVQMESINQIVSSSEETSSEECGKQIKDCEDSSPDSVSSKQEDVDIENVVETNLKDEVINGDNSVDNALSSNSEDEDDEDTKKTKQKEVKKKERAHSPSDEPVRRMRLFGFWSGPKRHRVASLNALAKVHCLYENETGCAYLGGFCKPKPEKEKQEKQKKAKEEKEEQVRKEKEKKVESKGEENVPKRKLRNVPGLRGKHWDMLESSSSSSSSDDESEHEKNTEHTKKKVIKRKKKKEEVMDLKDMVVCKRMASLNATAILAASYSDEKNRCGSSSDSSSESEVEIIRKRKQNDSDIDKRKSRQNSEQEDVLKPSNKLLIVNQDTDVTITGVYVNQTRSTHHEGFCSIAGMQYRISSTSHTQTAATAVATELHDQQKLEQPCKSYTPLGALSSMQPPGSQGSHPDMSPRRHSAFSAPHQHGYYQPAGPLIQHPPTLPPIKGPPPEPTPTPPQNSEGSDDLVATSTTSGGTSSTGGGFYRAAYYPQYYGTPPQYPDLCYPPAYTHPHAHPTHYYKYAPNYRRYTFRQYYGYQETSGGGPGSGATAGGPVVDYQPPPPGEYPLPPYYGGYPPPPPPPPPPPNPAYLHSQGRPFVDHAACQSCPCPMQSCSKNVDTGPLIGNGKGAPVVSGPGLSLPPSALVGPPSPARGLAGLAPPHGANAWDTDRVQLNTHRNLNQNQPSVPSSHNLVGGHNRSQNSDCKDKGEKECAGDKLQKYGCQKRACTSTCEVKMETLSPTEKLTAATCQNFKLENNNVKCESCSVEMGDNLSCVANCNVKCESDYKCDIMKCEQCMKEDQMTILEIDKDTGILLDDKLDTDPDVKEELNDVVVIDTENWKKPDYEPTVQETIDEIADKECEKGPETEEEHLKCQKVTKRKLSLDSLSDSRKKRKLSKRTLSVGSSQDLNNGDFTSRISIPVLSLIKKIDINNDACISKKKQPRKDNQNQKRKVENSNSSENVMKKSKISKQSTSNNISSCLKNAATDNSIMETINNVIQQSLQMTQKKDRKGKNADKLEKMKKEANLLSVVKKVAKKVDLVKELATEKLSKVIARSGQPKSKADARMKSKAEDKYKAKAKGKSKVSETKGKDNSKKHDSTTKSKTKDASEMIKKPALIKKKRKSVKKPPVKKTASKIEDCAAGSENLTLPRKIFLKPKWSNGWSWEGDSFEAKVYLTNEESAIRRCYASMKHESGDVLRPRDCVLLKSGPRKADLPFVAKIAALWENPDDGEMMFSLLWYYRPEHTEQGRTQYDTEDEVFASRHRDANSVACIEDKCYILTFNEYCRYRKNLRRIEEGLESPGLIVPPGDQLYPRENRQPPIPVPPDMVLFCRRVYDYRGKKLVKNPG